ncbi:MAG: threonylcarbamoyl-AMP synthase [Christensenellaceae bacterium]|nr:threonylcarbamoyl-AMP synthase [Christensenellaceae bacterium]
MKTQVFDLKTEYQTGMDTAAQAIADGKLVIFPTETVYGLGADALNPEAVGNIFSAKGRPQDNPLIVHIADFDQLKIAAAEVSPLAEKLMKAFWPGPFTAVLKKSSAIPDCVSAGLDTVGIRMPSSADARELIRRSRKMIAAPSANRSGRPSPTRASHCIEDMDGRVDVILAGDPADYGMESTVCDLTGDVPVILRPGGITAEMIEREAGCVEIANAVLNGLKDGETAASPGMKYKHYSPNAKVTIVEADTCEALEFCINLLYDKDNREGRNPLILCSKTSEKLFGNRRTLAIGANEREIAHRFFDELRNADAAGIDRIYFEATSTTGIGLAVMNRAIRAAGFDIIKAEDMLP